MVMFMPHTKLQAADVANLLHPYTNLPVHHQTGPLVVTRGQGVFVYDEQGRDYIEGLAGLWCTSLGWGEERLVEAAARQMRELPFYHLFGSKSHPAAIQLAERLASLAPITDGRVFLANSGSEANDTAVKLIWYRNNALGRPAKKKIIARDRAYHGVTLFTASMTGLPVNHRGFDLPLDGILRTACPHYWRNGLPHESEDQFCQRLAQELDDLIMAEGPDTIAAFFAEPVQGAGGVVVPPATYFAHIQPVLQKHDILLVADEVITGFGRTGQMFGSQTFGLHPDMMVVAKGLSSGYLPISALIVRGDLVDAISAQAGEIGTLGHGFTYGGHPVAAAVALETLNIYQERDILGHVAQMAPLFQKALHDLAAHPLVGEARGIGLIGAVELVADKATKTPFPPARTAGALAMKLAQENGLILRAMGDTVALSPPLTIKPLEIEQFFDRLRRALDQLIPILST